MTRLLLAFALSLLVGQACLAGAWMRDEGEGFLSLGFLVFEDADTGTRKIEQNVFLDYGLRPRLTIGAQVNFTPGDAGDGLLFVRLPLRDDDRPAKLAVEVGLGAESTDGVTFDPILKAGVSWGRGLSFGDRGGWINVDSAVQWATDDTPALLKLDATLGLNLSERFQVMGQAFLDADENGESIALIPSVIYKPRRGTTRFVVGLEHKTGRDERTGVRFGLWREF